jgi:hypothetical protein
MSKKYILLSILIISSVFFSGCVFENNNKPNQTIGPDFIPRTNLPPGFTFMGVHETTMDIANSSVSGFEGVYRYGGKDIYIAAIKHDDPETLLSQYKADLRTHFNKDYDPFEEISINGHTATKLTDIIILDGKDVPRYSIIWANRGYLIQVGSFADVNPVVVLASATGY